MRLILCWLTGHRDIKWISFIAVEAPFCGRCGWPLIEEGRELLQP